MLDYFKFFSVLFVLLIVQSALVPFIDVKGVAPDLILVFIVYWSLSRSRSQAVVLGFLGGLLQDLVGGGTVGVFALSKSVACYVGSSFPKNLSVKRILVLVIVLSSTALVHQVIYSALASRGVPKQTLILFLRYGIPSVFYTVICGVLSYGLIEFWKERRGRR